MHKTADATVECCKRKRVPQYCLGFCRRADVPRPQWSGWNAMDPTVERTGPRRGICSRYYRAITSCRQGKG